MIFICVLLLCTIYITVFVKFYIKINEFLYNIMTCQSVMHYTAPKEVLKLTVRRTVITHQPALSISWTVPQSDSPIKYYDLEYKSVNQSGWDYQATTISSIKLVNLQPGVLYNIRVRAVSALGNGIWSKVFQETTFSSMCMLSTAYVA